MAEIGGVHPHAVVCLQFLAVEQLQPLRVVEHQQAVTAASDARERIVRRAACLLYRSRYRRVLDGATSDNPYTS